MPQNPDIHATGWEVWKRWTFACSVALVIGVPFGFGLGAIPVGWIDPDPIGYLIGAAVFGVVVGTTLGIGQRIVLSRVLPVAAPRWTRMTVAGALGGCVASPFVIVAAVGLQIAEVSFWVIVPLSGAVMGATIGLAQRFALPPFFPRGWWVLGSSVSWCLGVSLFAIGCSLLENVVAAVVGSGNVGEGTVGLAFILVAPVVNGALSGAPWLVFRRSASTSCLSCGYDLTGIGGDICPECGQQRAGSGATRAGAQASVPSGRASSAS